MTADRREWETPAGSERRRASPARATRALPPKLTAKVPPGNSGGHRGLNLAAKYLPIPPTDKTKQNEEKRGE